MISLSLPLTEVLTFDETAICRGLRRACDRPVCADTLATAIDDFLSRLDEGEFGEDLLTVRKGFEKGAIRFGAEGALSDMQAEAAADCGVAPGLCGSAYANTDDGVDAQDNAVDAARELAEGDWRALMQRWLGVVEGVLTAPAMQVAA